MATIDEAIQRVQAAASSATAALKAAAPPLLPAHLRLGMSIPIGTRVLDLVTGEKGVVINGRRENVILPPAGNAGSRNGVRAT